jgi:multimeric flavodoxin WrbA
MTQVRKGQAPGTLERAEFHARFERSFADPRFDKVRDAVAVLEDVAWRNYCDGRKAPLTAPAGAGFADPGYELSTEWKAASERLKAAEARQKDPATPSRVLLICGAARNDGSCPGEMSKSWRLLKIAEEIFAGEGIGTDILDLSRLTSEVGLLIHPCKGCVSTAQPLCHWPCSCYPNHSLHQVNDWMNEIYERWVSAHAIIIFTPVYWYQAPSVLKLMIDRLVCADGGNPDPSSTHGKKVEEAKALELKGWSYPKHLAGRAYGLVVHGDVAGVESLRRNLADWLDWMGLIDAGALALLDRFLGYYEPYATSHDALDKDEGLQEEVRNVARAVLHAVCLLRAGGLQRADSGIRPARPK